MEEVQACYDSAFPVGLDSPPSRAACVARLRAAAARCVLAMRPGAAAADDAIAALRDATLEVAALLSRLRQQEALASLCGAGEAAAEIALARLPRT